MRDDVVASLRKPSAVFMALFCSATCLSMAPLAPLGTTDHEKDAKVSYFAKPKNTINKFSRQRIEEIDGDHTRHLDQESEYFDDVSEIYATRMRLALVERDFNCIAVGFIFGVCVTLILTSLLRRPVEEPTKEQRDLVVEAKSSVEPPPPPAEKEKVPDEIDMEYSESLNEFWPRTFVLALMLMVQSLSSVILMHFQGLIQDNPEIVYFLTMLVGLGGNAGGQSVVLTVRAMALGKEVSLAGQCLIGLCMGFVLAPVAFLRAYMVDSHSIDICFTIAVSVIFIALFGCALGCAIPKLFKKFDIDPGHTSPVVQVMMDMLGLTSVCLVGRVVIVGIYGH